MTKKPNLYYGLVLILAVWTASPPPLPAQTNSPGDAARLAELIRETTAVSIPTSSAAEYTAALETYRGILERLAGIESEGLGPDDRIDLGLLEAWLKRRVFEIDKLRYHEVIPGLYIILNRTSSLLLRPGSRPESALRSAVSEMNRQPEILENARTNLKRPARIWTEDALYKTYYARILLEKELPALPVENPELAKELSAAAETALAAVRAYESWMREILLARSDRSPTWDPADMDYLQKIGNRLEEFPMERLLKIALEEEEDLLERMHALAERIHPSGDLRKVWEIMKDEAPPWEEVPAMAQSYVDRTTHWLRGPGSHLLTISKRIDYGVAVCPPMGRRSLSFGGAYPGYDLAGRPCGYYVLTPLEDRLTPEEKASRIRSYNPYWTHVISYHEWLGHVIQLATASMINLRPVRRLSHYNFTQGWSFYLEKLLEDEGYFDGLPYMEALKTRMARMQMRMWRVQRIITKIRMANGEMSFEQAVQAYINKIGMEPTNSYIEVQRDCQSATPPGSEILGDLMIRRLREEYRRRMGPHFSLKKFHDNLISHGELPFAVIRELMFRE